MRIDLNLAYGTYVLQTEWVWDHVNPELATVTNEGREGYRYEPDMEVLMDPSCPEETRRAILFQLRRVADVQNKSAMGGRARLVRLYRIVAVSQTPAWATGRVGDPVDLKLTLQPICDFDKDDNPVPLGSVDAGGVVRTTA